MRMSLVQACIIQIVIELLYVVRVTMGVHGKKSSFTHMIVCDGDVDIRIRAHNIGLHKAVVLRGPIT